MQPRTLHCLPVAFRLRKSVNLGPFRVNLSRSGAGFSVGGRGFRAGVDSRGRKYTSVGIPGTGLSWRKSGGGLRPPRRNYNKSANDARHARGCLFVLICAAAGPAALAGLWAAQAVWRGFT